MCKMEMWQSVGEQNIYGIGMFSAVVIPSRRRSRTCENQSIDLAVFTFHNVILQIANEFGIQINGRVNRVGTENLKELN